MEERLRKFVTIIEVGSFTAAAIRLHTSQPGLSMAVQKLERELGVVLLETQGRGFKLTAAGTVAYHYGRRLLRENKRFRRELEQLSDARPSLRIGAIDSIAELLFVQNDLLKTLDESYEVTLQVNNTNMLIEQVFDGDCDVVFIVAGVSLPDGIKVQPVGYEELLFVCAPRLYASVTDRIKLGILQHFINYNVGSNTYGIIDEYLHRQGIESQPTLGSTSPELMLRMALAGKGTAVLPAKAVEEFVHNGKLVVLHVGDMPLCRKIAAVYANGSESEDMMRLIEMASDALKPTHAAR